MTNRLQRLSAIFLLLFSGVALALAYWGLVRSSGLLARDDNARLVEAELRVLRGRILDRNGVVLAETVGDPGGLERNYPQRDVPAVGHYSMRYGVSGVEASYDDVLRGRLDEWEQWINAMLHRPPVGSDVQLTIDSGLQAVVNDALGDRVGAAVLIEARSGEILALASHPGYDRNLLEEQFDTLSVDERGPLLNRATQALYQPGTALQPLLLAAGLEHRVVQTDMPVRDVAAPVQVPGAWMECASAPPQVESSIAAAMAHACPGPFAELAIELGPDRLAAGLADLGLLALPGLPLELARSTPPEPTGGDEGLIAEGMGQGNMTVSPLQMAWMVASIANDGDLPALRLVRRIGSEAEGWELVVPAGAAVTRGMSAQTAEGVTQAMRTAVQSGAASGAAVGGQDVAGHVGTAVSGPGNERNHWFLGFAPALAPRPFARYVVVVLLEENASTDEVASIGGEILAAACLATP